MSTEQPFDMVEYWNSLSSDPIKSKLYRALYRIESICQQHWDTMPSEAQSEIIDKVQEALKVVQHLPDGLPE